MQVAIDNVRPIFCEQMALRLDYFSVTTFCSPTEAMRLYSVRLYTLAMRLYTLHGYTWNSQ